MQSSCETSLASERDTLTIVVVVVHIFIYLFFLRTYLLTSMISLSSHFSSKSNAKYYIHWSSYISYRIAGRLVKQSYLKNFAVSQTRQLDEIWLMTVDKNGQTTNTTKFLNSSSTFVTFWTHKSTQRSVVKQKQGFELSSTSITWSLDFIAQLAIL